nr:MAG TPA: hypothetical protein [Bacteriophage sp.]
MRTFHLSYVLQGFDSLGCHYLLGKKFLKE